MDEIEYQPVACFGDIVELDHVCTLLADCVETLKTCPGYDLIQNSPIKPLLNAVEAQKRWQRNECDKRIPGVFDRSFLPGEYCKVQSILEAVFFNPDSLIVSVDSLVLGLHRLMIIGNMAEDRLNNAISRVVVAEKQVEEMAPDADTGKRVKDGAKNAVKQRADQKIKAAFDEWSKISVSSSKPPKTIDELQGMDGFLPEWSKVSTETLKKWARAAGFKFKAGRPKKGV